MPTQEKMVKLYFINLEANLSIVESVYVKYTSHKYMIDTDLF